jgi:hypothetical protein
MSALALGLRKLGRLHDRFRPPLLNRVPAALLLQRKQQRDRKFPPPDNHGWHSELVDDTPQSGADPLVEALRSDAPLLVTRFGYVELECLLNYVAVESRSSLRRAYSDFMAGHSRPFWWDHRWFRSMANNAGFFPDTVPMIRRYGETILELIPQIDILASWLKGEQLLEDRLRQASRIPLAALEPFHFERPWTEALAGKRVLVVHPFERSIHEQYAKRERLFADPRVLPEFELIVVRAPQSIAGNKTGHASWFHALDDLTERVAAHRFDVALLGCGAYGMPLAARIKAMGRQAIHVGGSLQLFFGIRGKRWEDRANISRHFNEHWIAPHESERPASLHRVEGGCYW